MRSGINTEIERFSPIAIAAGDPMPARSVSQGPHILGSCEIRCIWVKARQLQVLIRRHDQVRLLPPIDAEDIIVEANAGVA